MPPPGQYQFIGPLKPGQKPPVPNNGPKDDQWSILDLLKTNDQSTNSGASSSSLKAKKPKKFVRAAGGTVWEDQTLADWDPDDYRAFVGDLGNDVTDELLTSTFDKYPSFLRAKVVRDNRTKKSKGYGFVSFKDPQDYGKAIKEWDGKYLGSRPIKLRKSLWRDRSIEARKNKTPATIANASSSSTATIISSNSNPLNE